MNQSVYGTMVALVLHLPIAGQAAEPAIDDDIIVTATRSAIPLGEAIVPVTVITRQDIEQSLASDLAELLRFEAGVEIGRNGGPGQSTSVFLRGTESNHTLLLIDGVRVNPGTVGGAALHNIAPETIERIEIVKGARSALFGTDAIGGVINVITRRHDSAYLESSVGGGSFETRSGFAAAGRRTETGDVGIGVNFQQTDGFPARTDSHIDRGYDNVSANFHAGKRLGAHYLAFRHWQATGVSEYFDFFLVPLDQDFRNASTALELQSDIGRKTASKVVLSHVVDEITQNQSDDFVESNRNTLDWQLDYTSGNHHWIGGLYFVDENAGVAAFGSGFDEDTRVKAVFAEHQWSQNGHRTFAALRVTDHETFGNHVTWNVEYAHALGDDWQVTAGLGHAFRAPDATDRFGFGGSPDLDPEIADQAQLGLRYSPDARQSLGLELYYNDISDLIEFDLSTFTLRNIGEAEIRGAELRWEYRGESYSMLASLVRQSADNATDNSRLPRRAEETMTLGLTRNIGPHRVGLSALASGDRTDVGDLEMGGYVLANLTGQIALGERWRLNARIENLLDARYETAAGFRMQERSYFIDLGFDWR
jgi:vitamin B12 transporter